MPGSPAGGRRYYECRDCFRHLDAETHRSRCPACGGRLQNIAVPRE